MIGEFRKAQQRPAPLWTAFDPARGCRYSYEELRAMRLKAVDAYGRRVTAVRAARLHSDGLEVWVRHTVRSLNGDCGGPAMQLSANTSYDVAEFCGFIRGGKLARV